MSDLRTLARTLPAVIISLMLCPSARADDEVESRQGKFVRVLDPASIVVKRFNRSNFFNLLGVQPFIGLDRSDPLEKEATEFLTSLLQGRRVVLRLDEAVPRADESRTHIGYLYLEDGTCLNEEVLRRGYGTVDGRMPFSRLEAFSSLERGAKEQERGVWKTRQRLGQSLEETPCSDGTIAYAGTCGVTNPVIIPGSRVVPRYPYKAVRKNIEGRVVLKAVISRDGRVRDIVPLNSPSDQLTEAAIAAVEKWRYRPALKDGQPVDAYFTVVVEFYLASSLRAAPR